MHARKIVAAVLPIAALALPGTAAADYRHVVIPGESLASIAATDGLSVGALAAANGLSSQAWIDAGEVLLIPPQSAVDPPSAPVAGDTAPAPASDPAATAVDTPTVSSAGSYIVQPGDTLSALAARVGTTVAALAALNGLNADRVLEAGAVLSLPGGASATASTTNAAAQTGPATGPGNQQLPGATGDGPYPTAQSVSSSQVGSEASIDGVDPAFAAAVADQESGFSNDVVSSTGAVGVMQIEPATWSWIITDLAKPGAPLSPSSAYSNVAGGVRLLHSLVAQTGSEEMAAAAYYQGLESVRENGLYPSTEQYVADVMALTQRYGG